MIKIKSSTCKCVLVVAPPLTSCCSDHVSVNRSSLQLHIAVTLNKRLRLTVTVVLVSVRWLCSLDVWTGEQPRVCKMFSCTSGWTLVNTCSRRSHPQTSSSQRFKSDFMLQHCSGLFCYRAAARQRWGHDTNTPSDWVIARRKEVSVSAQIRDEVKNLNMI